MILLQTNHLLLQTLRTDIQIPGW